MIDWRAIFNFMFLRLALYTGIAAAALFVIGASIYGYLVGGN
jgi:hypothetical protein